MTSWTKKDIEKLEKAIASGVQSVSYDDRTVNYRSLEEMKETLADMRKAVEDIAPKRRRNPDFDSGL